MFIYCAHTKPVHKQSEDFIAASLRSQRLVLFSNLKSRAAYIF